MTASDWQTTSAVVQAVSAAAIVVLTICLTYINVRTVREMHRQTDESRAQWQLSEIPFVGPIDATRGDGTWHVTFKNLAATPVVGLRLAGINEVDSSADTEGTGLLWRSCPVEWWNLSEPV